MNHVDGFDCPSCAWGDPDPDHRKVAEFCENGVKAVAWEATRKRVDAAFFADHSVAALRERDGHWLESQGRLARPMHLAPGATHYEPIPWEDALALTGIDVDTRSDIFSLGVLLYELLTGATPVDASMSPDPSFSQIRKSLLTWETLRPSEILAKLPPENLRALATASADRAQDLLNLLQEPLPAN